MPEPNLSPYLNLVSALREFVTVTGTQAQQHIRPIHKCVASRLVLEGGFHPDDITPHPPLRDDLPASDSPLQIARFFDALYATYDLRFPYVAASMVGLRRLEWDSDSPALRAIRHHGEFEKVLGYLPRLA
jgi:hypothetical protein